MLLAEGTDDDRTLVANSNVPERVEVEDGLQLYLDAWYDLMNDRSIGGFGGASGIFYSSISRYAQDTGRSGENLSTFKTLVRAIDAEYLDWLASKQPKQSG